MSTPESEISHIILTRFNLPSKGRESKIRQSPNWLENRFELFETYCLPSVLQQSNTDFKWFIYFDVDTPEPFRTRAENLAQSDKQITLFWTTNIPLAAIKKHILSQSKPNKKLLLTTRLDNDDALSNSFVHELQTAVAQQGHPGHPQVFNCPNGLVLSHGRVYSHYDASNAFASLLEPMSSSIQTIWQYQHTQLYNFGLIHQLELPTMWLQIIHGNNVSNRIRGYRVSSSKLSNTFPVSSQQFSQESRSSIILDNIILFPMRQIKEFCRRQLKILFLLVKGRH